MAHVKKGDTVLVIAGKDKGASGEILDIVGDRVIVSGVQLVKKHSRALQPGDEGGIVTVEAPIHISNVKKSEKKTEKKKEGKKK